MKKYLYFPMVSFLALQSASLYALPEDVEKQIQKLEQRLAENEKDEEAANTLFELIAQSLEDEKITGEDVKKCGLLLSKYSDPFINVDKSISLLKICIEKGDTDAVNHAIEDLTGIAGAWKKKDIDKYISLLKFCIEKGNNVKKWWTFLYLQQITSECSEKQVEDIISFFKICIEKGDTGAIEHLRRIAEEWKEKDIERCISLLKFCIEKSDSDIDNGESHDLLCSIADEWKEKDIERAVSLYLFLAQHEVWSAKRLVTSEETINWIKNEKISEETCGGILNYLTGKGFPSFDSSSSYGLKKITLAVLERPHLSPKMMKKAIKTCAFLIENVENDFYKEGILIWLVDVVTLRLQKSLPTEEKQIEKIFDLLKLGVKLRVKFSSILDCLQQFAIKWGFLGETISEEKLEKIKEIFLFCHKNGNDYALSNLREEAENLLKVQPEAMDQVINLIQFCQEQGDKNAFKGLKQWAKNRLENINDVKGYASLLVRLAECRDKESYEKILNSLSKKGKDELLAEWLELTFPGLKPHLALKGALLGEQLVLEMDAKDFIYKEPGIILLEEKERCSESILFSNKILQEKKRDLSLLPIHLMGQEKLDGLLGIKVEGCRSLLIKMSEAKKALNQLKEKKILSEEDLKNIKKYNRKIKKLRKSLSKASDDIEKTYSIPTRMNSLEDLDPTVCKDRTLQLEEKYDLVLGVISNQECFLPIKKSVYQFLNPKGDEKSYTDIIGNAFETYAFTFLNEKKEEEEKYFVTIFENNVKNCKKCIDFFTQDSPEYLNESGKKLFKTIQEEGKSAFFNAIQAYGKIKIFNISQEEKYKNNKGVRLLLSHSQDDLEEER